MFLPGRSSGHKDRGFSSKDKVQQHHGDGTETIIVMGKPFRVLQKLSDTPAPYLTGTRRRMHKAEGETPSAVFLVENSSRMSEFPRHLALKRSFFPVDQVQEAHKEIEILGRIKDKNIVKVFHSEISRSEGKLGVSIAMEYCGNNLYRRIRSGAAGGAGTRLSESEICHVLLAVTSALGYLHSQQPPIAHRDLRPENVLINNNQSGAAAFKLCNFRCAATEAYQCETREEASMAINDIEQHTNPGFRSPEMADPWSKRRICEKSDMWSLGVLLYFMMYLKLPFEPTNMALSGEPRPKFPVGSEGSRYCGSLRCIVEHLLDPNPESRWDVFALTNYLRFDDDISKHLGTFCFTCTEYPEGWEEQDVKVIGRDVPSKPPPVTYGNEPGHAAPAKTAPAATSRKASPAAAGGRGGGGGAEEDAVREAMMVLGGDGDDDDPEMAQYREMIIREQEEALARFKSKTGRSDEPSSGSPAPGAGVAAPSSPKPLEEEKPPEKKKDLFDDLFAGPAPQQQQPQQQQQQQPPQSPAGQQQPGQAASTSNSPNPQALQPQQQQQPAPKKDLFSADDLFGPGPQVQQQQSMPMGGGFQGSGGNMYASGGANNFYGSPQPPQQQQQQQQQPAPNNYGGGWGTGAPQPQPQQQPWGGAAGGYGSQQPPQQQQQQQQYPPMGGGMPQSYNYGMAGTASMGNNAYAPQQQQQQQQQSGQGSMNFMAGPPNQQQPQQQQQTPPPPATAVKKKDPFADLFS